MGNWKPWTYPAQWSLEEHNAVLAELRKAEAELERMGRVNNDACDKIAELEAEHTEAFASCSAEVNRLAGQIALRDKRIAELEREAAEMREHPVYTGALSDEELGRLGYEAYRDGDSQYYKWEELTPRFQAKNIAHGRAVRNAVAGPLLARITELEKFILTPEEKADLHTIEELRERITELEAQLAAVPRVDPEAWRTPLQIGCATAKGSDWFRLWAPLSAKKAEAAVFSSGMTCCSDMLPADAARAAVWLASYAQAHGAPVDITDEIIRAQHQHHVEVLSRYFQGGAPYAHLCEPGGPIVDGLPKLVEMYEDLKAQQPAPIAPAETLEALAEIGRAAWYKAMNHTPDRAYKDLPQSSKNADAAQTAAILRAARDAEDARIAELEAELAVLHDGETVEGVVMERDHYRIKLDNAKQDIAIARDRIAELEAQLAAVKEENAKLLQDIAAHAEAEQSWVQDEPRAIAELAAVTAERDALSKRFTQPIVCMCGSTKFKQTWIAENARLTNEGNIVLSVGLWGHHERVLPDEQTKKKLDDLHKRKIDLSDWVWVLDVGGYIGESTRSEIDYALSLGKRVRYLSLEFQDYVEPIDHVLAERDALRKERDQLAQNLIQRNLPDFYRLLKTTADAPPMEEVARQAECEDVELVTAVWQHASEYFEGKIKELALERDAFRAELAAARKWNSETLAENNRLDKALEVERDRCTDLLSDKKHLEDQLAARATRPVKVRFDMDFDDLVSMACEKSGWSFTEYGHASEYTAAVKDILYQHAVIDVPPGVPTLEDLAELIYIHVRTGRNYATSEPELKAAAAAIRDRVLAGLPTPEPAPAPLSVEGLRGILEDVCGVNTPLNECIIDVHDSDIPNIHAALLPYLREPVAWELDTPENGWLSDGFCIFNPATGESHSLDSFVSHVVSRIRPVFECQECAAAKRAVQIERDGVNALAARINAARAALEGEA